MSISLKAIDTRVTALENKIVNSGYMVPNWSKSNAVASGSMTKTSPFTASVACLFMVKGYHSRSGRNLYINGVDVARLYFDYGGNNAVPVFLNKGDQLYTTASCEGAWFPLIAMKL